MAKKENHDLHGNAPDKSAVALLLIDLINAMDFPGGKAILKQAISSARRIAKLKKRCRRAGIPAIYVNDNFGRWRSDFKHLLKHCQSSNVPGRALVRLLPPDKEDYFVLKPKHSGFFASTLSTLLEYLNVNTLIITGICSDICVLFTANDAYMRDFKIIVPSDCVASKTARANKAALELMKRVLKADIRPAELLDLEHLARSIDEKAE
jgi:nicotinamidase-related amidase